jgi:hypothetical protein
VNEQLLRLNLGHLVLRRTIRSVHIW